MMMRMLHAGGVPIASDGVRQADASNPVGYFEHERVKDLDKGGDSSWLLGVRGKAIKVISFLLKDLPDTNNYLVVFMRRDLGDVLASQEAMLAMLGTAPGADDASAERMAAGFRSHLADVQRLLARGACFDVIYVEYSEVIRQPSAQADMVARFLNLPLDTRAMAAAVDRTLQHQHGQAH